MADPPEIVGPRRPVLPLGIPPKGVPPTDRVSYADLVARGKLRPLALLDVREFGAAGDGSHDDAPAILRAVVAAKKSGGGELWLPPGNYLINSEITVDAANVRIVGAGLDNTKLTRGGTTGNAIRFTNNADSCAVRDLSIVRSTGATAGAAICADSTGGASGGLRVDHVYVENFFRGLELLNVTNAHVRDFSYNHSEKPAGISAAIYVDGAGEHFFDAVKRGGTYTTSDAFGLYIIGNLSFVQGIRLSNFSFIGAGGTGIYISGGTSGGAYMNITNGDIGEQIDYGVRLYGTLRAINISNVNTVNCGADGFRADAGVTDSGLVNCKVRGGQYGYAIVAQNFSVSNCRAHACAYDGFYLDSASNHVTLTGCRARACGQSGCEVEANTDNYIIVGNNFLGNTGTDFVDNGVAPKVVDHNLA